jgi:alkanesulfonate monooxygenase SsuD/methylene tetrahydromethanopterin reductase-like flavin-dependent oxidoreductase (luciferase family)
VVKPIADSYARRSEGRDPRSHLAVGDAAAIIGRIREYVDAGISKFILRPIGATDDELIDQTRLLAREVIPEVERWQGP